MVEARREIATGVGSVAERELAEALVRGAGGQGCGGICVAEKSLGEGLTVFVECADGTAGVAPSLVADRLHAALIEEWRVAPDEVVCVAREGLPRSSQGEPLAYDALQRYRRGVLPVVHVERYGESASGPEDTDAEGLLDAVTLFESAMVFDDEASGEGAFAAGEDHQPAEQLSLELMRQDVAELLGEPLDGISEDIDLTVLGLDSIMIMTLVNRWRADGAEITFGELFAKPVLKDWWAAVTAAHQAAAEATDEGAAGGGAELVPDGSQPFDLALMQHAYWIGRGDEQVLGGVAAHFYNEFTGRQVQADRLESAVRALIRRHAMLRAHFTEDGRQWIADESAWPGLTVHDLREESAAAADARLAQLQRKLSGRRLEVARGEVFDVQLSLLPDGGSRVHVNIDMLVADALSFRIVLADLASLYDAPHAALPPIDYSYPRYLAHRTRRRERGRETDRAYWHERLAELPGGPELPLAVEPERLAQRTPSRRHHWLSGPERDLLAARARKHGVTLSTVFATAFAEVLGAWSARKRFLLNLPLFDREAVHPDVFRLSGDFTNLLLLEVDLTERAGFLDRARQLHRRLQADMAHTEYSGVDVLRDLTRANGGDPVYAPVVFTSGLSLGELFSEEVRRCFGAPSWMISQGPQVWLDHQVTEHDGGLLLNWDAEQGLFGDGVLDAMFDAYRRIIAWLGGPEEHWDRELPSLLPEEQRAVRAARNDTRAPSDGLLLHEEFFRRAAVAPGRPALLWDENAQQTYGELAERALRIAGALRERGIAPGDTVAVTLPKGPGQVAAVLGVLAAGAAYVPVGVDQPLARRTRIYRRAAVRAVLVQADERPDPAWPEEIEPLPLDEAWGAVPLVKPVMVGADAVSYVIFTSGSTGEPKGVMVTHAAAVNTLVDVNERFAVGPEDRALAVSALDFDLSVYDIFGLLSAGGALVLVSEDERRDALRWADLVRSKGVTVWQSVPALLDMLLIAAEESGRQLPLRVALLGGDWVTVDLWDRLQAQAPGSRLAGLGGTTEAAIHSTVCEVTAIPDHWRSVPYGTPLANVVCRVVDGLGRDCPDWVPGELWIGGAGVALGYCGDAERTARHFMEVDGVRWYRTGDLGRYWPDGTLEFLGRADHQVKVRGHRIELGEVETALTAHPDVARAVVMVTGGTPTQLAVAVQPAERAPEPAELRAWLAGQLPSYMVPEQFLTLEQLPLNANGKVDRRRLADLLDARPTVGQEGEPPRAGIEQQVAAVWSELLGVSGLTRDDGFFALGGDSLLATRAAGRLRAAGLTGVELRTLLSRPVLKDFAASLGESGEPTPPTAGIVEDLQGRYEPFPLTEVQRAYWLGRTEDFALGGVASHWYWEFEEEDLDLARLETAWNRLVARHEMLRAVFGEDGTQRILPSVPPYRIEVVEVVEGERDAALAQMREHLSHQVLDSAAWPLFDIRAVRGDSGPTRIAFSLDLLILDALSIMIVFSELGVLYRDPDAQLAPSALSFRDYLLQVRPDPGRRQADWLYWRERAAELPPAPGLPLRTDPELVTAPRFTRREALVPRTQWEEICARARSYGLTPAAVLATCYAEVLSRWSGRPDVTLNLTLFDRQDVHPEVHTVVGDFTSLLLAGYRPRPGESLLERARRFQDDLWQGLDHGAVSAIEVLREMARSEDRASGAMPVVFTSALGVGQELPASPFGHQVWGLSQTPQVWLDHQVMDFEGGIRFNWDAVEELFPNGVLDAMFAAHRELVFSLADRDWTRSLPDALPAPQRAVRDEANATVAPAHEALLHQGFFEQAAVSPDALALACGDGTQWSFGRLADRALRVAGDLVARGVRPGDKVAVRLPKGPEQIAAVLGVLAAGGAYVPIGIDQPEQRADRIIARAKVSAVLTERTLDEAWGAVPLVEPVVVGADAVAYVIFTSGSTGEPKGVMVTHAAAVNTLVDVNERFAVGPEDRALAVSALDFDLSVYDIFGLLSAGGALVLVDESERREARHWAELVRRWGVTVWNTVPALLDMLLVAAEDEPPLQSLRLALVSGDWVGLDLRDRLTRAAPGCRMIALGGATEAAVWSNCFEVDRIDPAWSAIPYGRPLTNQRFRVVDGLGRDCPDWVPGELWIGGAGVALGYCGDAERTARQFTEVDGVRWYRTGDLGRYWPDGTLEFLGRADHQVKVRGHRIELGEVETVLAAHPGIAQCVVTTIGEPAVGLGAAVVAEAGGSAADGAAGQEALRGWLAERLPGYMLPELWVEMPALPLTANGKVDRAEVGRRLRGARPLGAAVEPPQGETERSLAKEWAELLDADPVGRNQSFFVLGGDSLMATRLVESLRKSFGVVVTLREFLAAPTVRQLAELIGHRCSGPGVRPMDEGSI
ncbi:amino acid adenylation domain-containing protein [Streptomyces sp. NPDC020883]|uniref:amino acid adenylation domain-containing protein n=1 Tax=Streptomyces sp. NPDC020883 TaxID=3365099 RepID=UPI0037A4BD24